MTALSDLLAACDSLAADTHYAAKTRALAKALRAWAPGVPVAQPVPTPTPTPTPTPVPPSGSLSFIGDFSTGDTSQWGDQQIDPKAPAADSVAIVTSPVRRGTYGAKFTAKQAYSAFGWKENTELGHGFTDQVQGSRFFYGLSMMLPVGTVDPFGFFYVAQWYTQNFSHFMGSPPMKLDAGINQLQFSVWAGQYNGDPSNAGYSYNSGWQTLDKGVYDGRWRDLIFDIAWSKNQDGHVIAYLRREGETAFAQVVSLTGIPTLRYDPAYNGGAADPIGLQKIGVYRDSHCNHDSSGNIFGPGGAHTPGTCYYGANGSQPDTVMYHAGMVRGSTFDAVAVHLA